VCVCVCVCVYVCTRVCVCVCVRQGRHRKPPKYENAARMGGATPRDGLPLPPESARKKTRAAQMDPQMNPRTLTHAARSKDTHENGEPKREQRGTLKVCVHSTEINI
jgi:hypothetical protein